MSRRFFFAYHEVNGLIFPFSWAENNGLPVGGIPKYLLDTRHEISQDEFDEGLSELEKKYPIPLGDVTSKVKE